MVGLPNYGVAFCLAPWPDGGWMAGVLITDRDWVTEQVECGEIEREMLSVPDEGAAGASWDITDGFKDGLVAYGDDAADAVDCLWAMVHGDSDPLRRHQRAERAG